MATSAPILNTTLPTLAEHQDRYYSGIMSDAFTNGLFADLRGRWAGALR